MTTTLDHELLIVALAVDLRFAEAEPMARAVGRWLAVGRGSLERWLAEQNVLSSARFRSLELTAALWIRDQGDPQAAAQRLRLDPHERAILARIHPAAARLLTTPTLAVPSPVERGQHHAKGPLLTLLAWSRSTTLAWLVTALVASTSAWRIQTLRHLLETTDGRSTPHVEPSQLDRLEPSPTLRTTPPTPGAQP
ncbi:hypothetical protein Isop_0855 [Isosphaera pallida ATCC 43644]|uniref:Uncharacterized protein n=1 Tax=Isosphaera pallida (strain ATCC 43644 / DSM 9630 / IS1B) TaxID=575540 RepID=E8R2G0_ISOPI|nr:hypothetical protein [Isosphaera pallida]ADV61445.1 hypothetical protein Isop_0855 [Isosphaera pallida ATCC 43644]